VEMGIGKDYGRPDGKITIVTGERRS